MLSIVIQAGGESRRMGQDKGLVHFLGQPLVERVAQRLAPIAGEILLTTNHPQAYAFVGLPMFSDVLPGSGALGGLYTALCYAHGPLVAVAACDMPFASPDIFAALAEMLAQSDADVAIPWAAGGWQPFHAVYRRESCLPPIEAALQAGRRRVDAWFEQVSLAPLQGAALLAISPDDRPFMNVNTPDELQQAEAMA
jgi:molybdopterin-guanine dinucleotide biosynthesis protein A